MDKTGANDTSEPFEPSEHILALASVLLEVRTLLSGPLPRRTFDILRGYETQIIGDIADTY